MQSENLFAQRANHISTYHRFRQARVEELVLIPSEGNVFCAAKNFQFPPPTILFLCPSYLSPDQPSSPNVLFLSTARYALWVSEIGIALL